MKTKLMKLLIGGLAFLPVPSFANPQCAGIQAVDSTADCTGTQLTTSFGGIIDTLFIVAGAVAVLIMVIGGIRYITSTGDSKRIQAAKDTILYAIMGLVVVILARAIVGFVLGNVTG
ncbi:MAG TPA: pilin [Candidatus Saccharimonadales bacterium]|nr:pilin [Candidatus Saccharimonadales bacterium]